MGNIIRRDGRLYHETGPGQEEQIAINDLGDPIVGILHGPGVQASVSGATIVLAIGSTFVSFPAAVAGEIIAALSDHAPEAKADEARQVLEGLQEKLDQDKRDRRAEVEIFISNRMEAVAVLDEEIAARKAELEKLEEGAAREDTDLPIRP